MPPKVSATVADGARRASISAGSSMASAESDEADSLLSVESAFIRPKPIITAAGANDAAGVLSPSLSARSAPPSPIQIAMPPTAMSIDEQRHRLMQDMLTMQSRLLGEQRVLQEIMQDSVQKADSYSIMAAAVCEQEEALRSEKQVLGECKRAEGETSAFEMQVLTHDVQGLQHQMERFRQLEAENSQLGEQMEALRQRRGDLCLHHAARQSQLNGDMLRFRIRLEQLFRKSVLEHSKQCQRAAFASLSDSDKQQLLQNVLLAEELSLQRVGMDNLRYRYDQLGQDCVRTRLEVSAFQHNSQAYATTIAQLRRIQTKIDAQAQTITAQYAAKLKEHEQLRRGVNLPASIAQLRSEVQDYEHSCRTAQASCSKWKARLAQAQHSRHLLKMHIHEAHHETDPSQQQQQQDGSSRSSGHSHSSSRLGRGTCGRPATPLDPRLLDYLLHYQPCAAPSPSISKDKDKERERERENDSVHSGGLSLPSHRSYSYSSSSLSLAPHTLVAHFGLAATQHRMAAASPTPLQLYRSLKTKLHHWTREDHRNPTDPLPCPSPHLQRTSLSRPSPRPATAAAGFPTPLSLLTTPTTPAPRPSRRDIYEARRELMHRQAPPLQHPLPPYQEKLPTHRPLPSRPRITLTLPPSRPTTSPQTTLSSGRYLLGRTAPKPHTSLDSYTYSYSRTHSTDSYKTEGGGNNTFNSNSNNNNHTNHERRDTIGNNNATWHTPRVALLTDRDRPGTSPSPHTLGLGLGMAPPTRRAHMQPFVTFKGLTNTIKHHPTTPSLNLNSPSSNISTSLMTGPLPSSSSLHTHPQSHPSSPKPTVTTRRLTVTPPTHPSHSRHTPHRSPSTHPPTKPLPDRPPLYAPPSTSTSKKGKAKKRRPLTLSDCQHDEGLQWGGHKGGTRADMPSRLRGTLHRALDANSQALQHISLQHRLERQRSRRRAQRAAAMAKAQDSVTGQGHA